MTELDKIRIEAQVFEKYCDTYHTLELLGRNDLINALTTEVFVQDDHNEALEVMNKYLGAVMDGQP